MTTGSRFARRYLEPRRAFHRTLAVVMGALLLMAACSDSSTDGGDTEGGGGPKELTPVTLQLNWVPNSSFAGFYVADSKGYYEDQGIQFTQKPGGPNLPDPTQIVAGGAADVGVRNMFSLLDAISKGADLVIIGARLQQNPYGILSLAENPITSVDQMCGKKIGSDTVDVPLLEGVLKANGLAKDCFDIVPVGADPGPLARGQIDGQAAYVTGQPVTLERQGIPWAFASFSDFGMPLYGDVIFVRRDFLEANHDALVGFMRATIQGWSEYLADPSEGIDLTMNEYGGAEAGDVLEDQAAITQAERPLMEGGDGTTHGLFWIDEDLIAGPMLDAMKKSGVTNLPPIDQLIDTSIIEEAVQG